MPLLTTKDMEKWRVEFRLYVAREQKRFALANQSHIFDEIVLGALELNKHVDIQQENYIKLETVDEESVRNLDRFLERSLDKCQFREQHDLIQHSLRKTLQNSRRQSIMMQQSESGFGAPLEPFCLFCASHLDQPNDNCAGDHNHHQQQLRADEENVSPTTNGIIDVSLQHSPRPLEIILNQTNENENNASQGNLDINLQHIKTCDSSGSSTIDVGQLTSTPKAQSGPARMVASMQPTPSPSWTGIKMKKTLKKKGRPAYKCFVGEAAAEALATHRNGTADRQQQQLGNY